MTPNEASSAKILIVFLGAISLFALIFAANFIVVSGIPLYFFILIISSGLFFLIKKNMVFLINTQDFFIFIFMFWLLIPVINANDIVLSFQQYYYYFISFYLFFFIRRFCFNKKDWFLLSGSMLLGGGVTSCLMILNWDVVFQGDRVNINNINSNYLAYGLITLLPLLYIFINHKERNKIYYIFLIIFTLAIFLTGSRGALIALILFYILFSFKKPIFGLGVIFLIISSFTVFLSFYDSLPQYWQARFDFHNATSNDIDWTSGRDATWTSAWKIFSENFIFGIGPNNFGKISGFEIGVHNVFLSLLVETGILGFILYFIIIVSILFFIIKRNFFLGLMLVTIEIPIFFTGVWESSPILWTVLSLLMAYIVLFSEDSRGC